HEGDLARPLPLLGHLVGRIGNAILLQAALDDVDGGHAHAISLPPSRCTTEPGGACRCRPAPARREASSTCSTTSPASRPGYAPPCPSAVARRRSSGVRARRRGAGPRPRPASNASRRRAPPTPSPRRDPLVVARHPPFAISPGART